jgi:hypothetical protein
MKYLTVFLLIVLLQLTVVDETMAQRSRANTSQKGSKTPALSNVDFSSWIGYKKFWNQWSQGFSVLFDGDIVYYLNQSKSIGLGAFGYVAGGGGQFNDGTYREPSFNWQAGIKSKLRTNSSFYSLSAGYGQISKYGEVFSGLTENVFNDFAMARLEYQAYGRRLNQQAWLPAAGIYFEGKMAIKKEIPVWSGNYSINHDLAPEIVKGAGELTVVDIKMGDLSFAWGLAGAVNMYDFKSPKVFYEVGTFLNPSYANSSVANFFVGYQNGIVGVKGINRIIIGASLDVSFLFKINQANSTKSNNNKRRSR